MIRIFKYTKVYIFTIISLIEINTDHYSINLTLAALFKVKRSFTKECQNMYWPQSSYNADLHIVSKYYSKYGPFKVRNTHVNELLVLLLMSDIWFSLQNANSSK